MNAEVQIPQEVLSEAEAAGKALEAAKTFPVPTAPAEYDAAAEQLRAIKARANNLEKMRKELKDPILQAGRRIDAFFREPLAFCTDAEKAIKHAMLTYDAEQRRARQEAERKAAEAARKERERMEREAAKAEQAARERREREEAKARALEEQGRVAEAEAKRRAAEEAEAAKMQEADMRRAAAQSIPAAPVVHMEGPQSGGISTREVWSARVTNKLALVKAVAEGKAPLDLLDVNGPMANKMARALKSGMQFDGLEAVCERTMAARAS